MITYVPLSGLWLFSLFPVEEVLLEDKNYYEKRLVIFRDGKLRFYPVLKDRSLINNEMIQFEIDCSNITKVIIMNYCIILIVSYY